MTTQNNFPSVQFGICIIEDNAEKNYLVPVDDSVQEVLVEMLMEFNEVYESVSGEKRKYEPSEKYASIEKLFMRIDDENVKKLKDLFINNQIPTNNFQLSDILPMISFYFALFNHKDGKLIGVKRPAQFKGLLKNKNKLVQVIDDTLKAVNDDIFKLDNDFDFIISKQDINILHPSGFVFIADVDKYVFEKSREATLELGAQIKFVAFDNLSRFVGTSKTAAKLIASIRSRNDLERIKKEKLIKYCKTAGIKIVTKGKHIEPEEDYMLDFLQVLDRRLYEMELTDEKELYIAESRHKKQL